MKKIISLILLTASLFTIITSFATGEKRAVFYGDEAINTTFDIFSESFELTRFKLLYENAKTRQGTGGRSYVYTALSLLLTGLNDEKANTLLNDEKITSINEYEDFEKAPFSMYWCMPAYIRIYMLYNTENGINRRDALKPETEANMKRIMWAFLENYYENVFTEDNNPLRITNSENHDALQRASLYLSALALSKTDDYGGKNLPDGKTLAEFVSHAEEFFIKYIDERAKIGLFVEGSENYRAVTLESLYNIYDFTDSETLKKKVKMFLDIVWIEYAAESIDGIRGSAKTRVYNKATDAGSGLLWTSSLGSLYFGLNKDEKCETIITLPASSYRPPEIAKKIARAENKGNYELVKSIPGKGTTEVLKLTNKDFPIYTLKPAGDVISYEYVTPTYAASTMYQDGSTPLTLISSQNRWEGAVFKGDKNARIYRYLDTDKSLHTHFLSMQKGPVMIFKKNTTAALDTGIYIYPYDFSEADGEIKTEGGWLFGEIYDSYYAVRAASGKLLQKEGKILLSDSESPFVIHLGNKIDDGSLDEFKKKIKSNPLTFDGNCVCYTDKTWGRFEFNIKTAERRLNGATYEYKAEKIMECPFINSYKNSGIFEINFGENKVVYDFNELTVKAIS